MGLVLQWAEARVCSAPLLLSLNSLVFSCGLVRRDYPFLPPKIQFFSYSLSVGVLVARRWELFH